MLKLFRKGKSNLSLELEGEIKIDENKIKSYEIYMKEEETKLIEKEILEYLKKITNYHSKYVDPYLLPSMYSYNKGIGYISALEDLSKYLAEKIEDA